MKKGLLVVLLVVLIGMMMGCPNSHYVRGFTALTDVTHFGEVIAVSKTQQIIQYSYAIVTPVNPCRAGMSDLLIDLTDISVTYSLYSNVSFSPGQKIKFEGKMSIYYPFNRKKIARQVRGAPQYFVLSTATPQ